MLKKVVSKGNKTVSKAKTKGAKKVATSTSSKAVKSKSQEKLRKKSKFKVGDYLIYPIHGVGRITAVSMQKVLGKSQHYYEMEIQNNKMKVMVPVENASSIGLRSIIAKKEVKKVVLLLKEEGGEIEEDWKLRYQNNMNKIKSGSIYSVAEVCRDLYRRACARELSLMERRLYESAYKLISSEVALSNELSIEEAGNMISEVLAG